MGPSGARAGPRSDKPPDEVEAFLAAVHDRMGSFIRDVRFEEPPARGDRSTFQIEY